MAAACGAFVAACVESADVRSSSPGAGGGSATDGGGGSATDGGGGGTSAPDSSLDAQASDSSPPDASADTQKVDAPTDAPAEAPGDAEAGQRDAAPDAADSATRDAGGADADVDSALAAWTNLVFSDEFDGTGLPDESKWTIIEWPPGRVNDEVQA